MLPRKHRAMGVRLAWALLMLETGQPARSMLCTHSYHELHSRAHTGSSEDNFRSYCSRSYEFMLTGNIKVSVPMDSSLTFEKNREPVFERFLLIQFEPSKGKLKHIDEN